jgi:hypothetical protein
VRLNSPLAKRIVAAAANEGKSQHSRQPLDHVFVADVRDADLHLFVPGDGLRSIRSQQTIPPRKIESEIAVGLLCISHQP